MNFRQLWVVGPTGVELAGALARLKKRHSPKDYPDLDVTLISLKYK